MQKSSVVSLLPNIIIDELIFLWLELNEISNVDTAFCNSIDRIVVLEVMRHSHFSIHCHGPISNIFGKWLLERGVKLNTLELGWQNIRYNKPVTHTDKQKLRNTSPIDTSMVKSLNIDYSNSCKASSVNYPNVTGIASIINNCPLLDSLFVSNMKTFSTESLKKIDDKILNQITILMFFSFEDDIESTVNGEFIEYIAAHCPNLTAFEIDCDGKNTKESHLIKLVKNCPKLSLLRIDYEAEDDDDDLIEIGGDFLRTIASCCPQLTALHVPYCYKLLDFEVIMNFILTAKNLKTYVMNERKSGWADYIMYESFLDDDNVCHKTFIVEADADEELLNPDGAVVREIIDLFEKCTDFTLIKFSQFNLLDSKIIETVAAHNPRLSGISIEECGNGFSGESLRQLLIKCKELTYLQVSCGENITLEDFKSIFCMSSSLTALHIGEENAFTAEVLIAILAANPQLKCLSISGTDLDNDSGLEVMAYLETVGRDRNTFIRYDRGVPVDIDDDFVLSDVDNVDNVDTYSGDDDEEGEIETETQE